VIRVFIVAASPLARAGLENLLTARSVKVVGSVATIDSLADQLSDVETDSVLIDLSGEPSEAALAWLTDSDFASEAAIVVLTDHSPASFFSEALRAGVRAVLPSDVSPDQLISSLLAAAAGLFIIHPAEVSAVLPAAAPVSQSLPELPEPLTRREREVLQMLAGGLGNKEIATRLAISDHTVKFHVASILGKLAASTRTEAVSMGIRRGLVLL
jgi:two-component system, NarL family, response regulator YdfI